MVSNLEKYKADLEKLISLGDILHLSIQSECFPEEFKKLAKKDDLKGIPAFSSKYQNWYSASLVLIKQLLPDRLNDFARLYEKPKTRKQITFENYVVEDYLQGLTVTKGWDNSVVVDTSAAIPKFRNQFNILKAVRERFENSLFDIVQLVQADLLDSELEAAKELLKNKFVRAAGAIGGVVLEKHLNQVCINHNLPITKKNPTIGDYIEILKTNGVIDIPKWRLIQHFADVRNQCDHSKLKEPTIDDVSDMLTGIEKVTKTLY